MDNQHLSTCKEVFKKINLYNKYAISNKGTVINLKTKLKLKPRLLKGYKRVALSFNGKAKDLRIHRLVGIAFIPNPENKPEINHIDGNRGNNNVSNLEWVTPKENARHRVNVLGVGDIYKGSRNGNARLTERDIRIIRMSSFPISDLALFFNVSPTQIRRIKKYVLWKHVDSSTTIES